jgi:hypothetical protein
MSTPAKRNKEKPEKKKCSSCNKQRTYSFFYKVDSPMFPDGMINICSHCVREQVDIEDMESVISFLRQIDKPFIQSYWDKSVKGKKYPLGTYIAKINSLHQVSDKNFDSTNESGIGTSNDVQAIAVPDVIETEEGETIHFTESLISKWGIGFKKHEYLQLEKFYQDMMTSYEVHTANHKQMLMKIAKLSVEMDKLLSIKDYPNYQKVSSVYNTLIDSAGFAPKNKKNGADATGMTSFSQVWAEIEKEGFVQPKMIDYPKDDIDYMLMFFVQFAQRFAGREAWSEPNTNWREEVVETENIIPESEDEIDE